MRHESHDFTFQLQVWALCYCTWGSFTRYATHTKRQSIEGLWSGYALSFTVSNYMHMSTQFCSICRAFYYHPLLFDFVLLCIHNSITCLWSSKCCGFKITCLGYSSQVLCMMFFHPTVNSYHLVIRQDFLELSYVFYFVQAMYTLLRSKSEQERRLLSALVNKVFSLDYFCFKNWQMPHFVIILT